MKATLDTNGGNPVLRLQNGGGFDGKRSCFDLPLTPEQVKSIAIHTELAR